MPRFAGLRLERMRASAQYRDGRFHNAAGVQPRMRGNRLAIASDFAFGGRARRPPGRVPLASPLEAWARPPSSGLRVTWLGHSTVLIEAGGRRLLTDPVFGARASPVGFAGPRRFHPPPVAIGQLPPLDAVLVSHDHFDHLCRASVAELAARRVPFITSLGVGAHLEACGVDPAAITELDWWERHEVSAGELALTAVPAQHFSGRGLGDRNATLWSSWAIAAGQHRLFFSGDTGLHGGLSEIARRCGPFDLHMLEIGAWNAAWGDIHLGPDNALAALAALGGGPLLPIHWGTFDLGLHPWAEPAESVFVGAAAAGARLITPRLGAAVEPAHAERPDPWWRAVAAAAAAGAPAAAIARAEPAGPTPG
jgi:L-ascorbate metabolism protein UlaG (beta-lactamase superfamily)